MSLRSARRSARAVGAAACLLLLSVSPAAAAAAVGPASRGEAAAAASTASLAALVGATTVDPALPLLAVDVVVAPVDAAPWTPPQPQPDPRTPKDRGEERALRERTVQTRKGRTNDAQQGANRDVDTDAALTRTAWTGAADVDAGAAPRIPTQRTVRAAPPRLDALPRWQQVQIERRQQEQDALQQQRKQQAEFEGPPEPELPAVNDAAALAAAQPSAQPTSSERVSSLPSVEFDPTELSTPLPAAKGASSRPASVTDTPTALPTQQDHRFARDAAQSPIPMKEPTLSQQQQAGMARQPAEQLAARPLPTNQPVALDFSGDVAGLAGTKQAPQPQQPPKPHDAQRTNADGQRQAVTKEATEQASLLPSTGDESKQTVDMAAHADVSGLPSARPSSDSSVWQAARTPGGGVAAPIQSDPSSSRAPPLTPVDDPHDPPSLALLDEPQAQEEHPSSLPQASENAPADSRNGTRKAVPQDKLPSVAHPVSGQQATGGSIETEERPELTAELGTPMPPQRDSHARVKRSDAENESSPEEEKAVSSPLTAANESFGERKHTDDPDAGEDQTPSHLSTRARSTISPQNVTGTNLPSIAAVGSRTAIQLAQDVSQSRKDPLADESPLLPVRDTNSTLRVESGVTEATVETAEVASAISIPRAGMPVPPVPVTEAAASVNPPVPASRGEESDGSSETSESDAEGEPDAEGVQSQPWPTEETRVPPVAPPSDDTNEEVGKAAEHDLSSLKRARLRAVAAASAAAAATDSAAASEHVARSVADKDSASSLLSPASSLPPPIAPSPEWRRAPRSSRSGQTGFVLLLAGALFCFCVMLSLRRMLAGDENGDTGPALSEESGALLSVHAQSSSASSPRMRTPAGVQPGMVVLDALTDEEERERTGGGHSRGASPPLGVAPVARGMSLKMAPKGRGGGTKKGTKSILAHKPMLDDEEDDSIALDDAI